MLITVKNILPGVTEGTNRTTAAGNVSMIAMLMQWTRNPTSSENEPWAEREEDRESRSFFFTLILKDGKLSYFNLTNCLCFVYFILENNQSFVVELI